MSLINPIFYYAGMKYQKMLRNTFSFLSAVLHPDKSNSPPSHVDFIIDDFNPSSLPSLVSSVSFMELKN